MRRADRLFHLVQLLRTRRFNTGAALAEELQISVRTVYRDVADLVDSGVPIEGEPGVGYRLRPGFELPPMTFTGDEIEAIVLGARMVQAWGDPERAKLRELHRRARGRTRREVQLRLGGEWKTLEVGITPLHDGEGAPTGHVIVLEDLTELIQAQKLATWNEAARRVAHEIKNPLTPIRLSAERLLKKYREGDPALGAAL